MRHLRIFTFAACLLLALTGQAQQPNIIFIVSDDLNDYIGVLGGHPQVQTPHIDSLAARGVTFLNNYCNAPGCAPSRTSMLSGKDIAYTQVYSNSDYINPFRQNFSEAKNNAVVFTLPEVLKNEGNYYTYALGKIYHLPSENDHDAVSAPCEKELSWNRMHNIQSAPGFNAEAETYEIAPELDFAMIPDSMEEDINDNIIIDSAVAFIHGFANNTVNTCDRPFFLALGLNRPHIDRFVPAHYFLPYYEPDLLNPAFEIIYNDPPNASPYNGLIMPPQPATQYDDYNQLPDGGLGQYFADQNFIFESLNDYVSTLPYLPEIDAGLSEEERMQILQETMRANYVSAYIAAVQFMDSMVGRVMDALNTHPELAANTVIVFTSDNGYALGEKKHFAKWALWETDIRTPLIIAHPDLPANQTSTHVSSLLDIFPTVCDIAGVPYPTFPDGSLYPDGKSLLPYLEDPGLTSASTACTTYKPESGQGSCFPHYSIRNDRFHYIKYRHNNDTPEGTGPCVETSAHYEAELYDIGQNRQTDPNEWNNLITDSNYAPVIEYLDQFIPGEPMYGQEPFSVIVNSNITSCFLDINETIRLTAQLADTNGMILDSAALTSYTITWTTNLLDDVITGSKYDLVLNDIPITVFNDAHAIIVYVQVTENASGKIIAFRMQEFQLHNEALPSLEFSQGIVNSTLIIGPVVLIGAAYDVTWNFGDGYFFHGIAPGPHTYVQGGSYKVTASMKYGNLCTTTQSFIAEIDTPAKFTFASQPIYVFPNPASEILNITGEQITGDIEIEIFNMQGQRIYHDQQNDAPNLITVPTGTMQNGIYIIRLHSEAGLVNAHFEIMN